MTDAFDPQHAGRLEDPARLAALPQAAVVALLRLDGDLFESTRDAIEALYDRVSPGGFILIDDYGCISQCRQAVTAFRERRAITEPIQEVDWTGAFWRKER